MKNFVDEYSIDYRNLIDLKSPKEKEMGQDLNYSEILVGKQGHRVFRKLVACVLLFIAVIVITYDVLKSKTNPTFLSTVYLNDDARKYDDFIFPVVMQDPSSFDSVEGADPLMLVSASLWKFILSKRIDKFDETGLGIIDEDDMWKGYDELFESSFHPKFDKNVETDFFKFDATNHKFYIKPSSNQSCYIPYTQECRKEKDYLMLKVGYVSPNDNWRSLKQDRPEKPTPTKFAEYRLETNSGTGNMYIKSVKRLDSEQSN